MTEDTDTTDEEPITEQSDAVTLAASTTYKILGELDADDGMGVLGRNTADSGTPIGVEGAVPNNSDGYGLSTPDDARVDGWLETPTVAIQSSGSFIDASGNSHLTINDGGPLGVDRMLDLSGNDISNASTVTATTTNTDSLAPNTSSSVTLAGPLDANSNDIINVGTVDGVDVTAHGSQHNPDGADALSTGTPVGISDGGNAAGTANESGDTMSGNLDMNGNDLVVEGNTQISGDSDVTVRIDNNDSASVSDEFRVLGNLGSRRFDVDNNGDAKVYNNLTVSNDLTVNDTSNFNNKIYTNGNDLDLSEGRFLNLRHVDGVRNDMFAGELAVDTGSDDLAFITSSSTQYTWSADAVSSVRYKENVEPWSADPYGALELGAKEYDLLEGPYGGDGPTQIGEYGFLAEEADECAPWVVQYVEITEDNKDGFRADDEHVGEYVPDRIDYDKFAIAHNEILADHEEKLDELEAELERKDGRIDQLEDETESLREENDRLRERNADLEARLERIESELGLNATTTAVADD